MSGHVFDATSNRVIGAAIAVHKSLGPGFGEDVYHKALCVELGRRGIPFAREVKIPVSYEGVEVGVYYLDLVVAEEVVVELKAVSAIIEVHQAQLTAYLRASGISVGLILNFGEKTLGIKRMVNNYQR